MRVLVLVLALGLAVLVLLDAFRDGWRGRQVVVVVFVKLSFVRHVDRASDDGNPNVVLASRELVEGWSVGA
jgi:hypothetical protein